ncbi:MAG: COX15/CtaA family protein [Bacteroidota bacterium]
MQKFFLRTAKFSLILIYLVIIAGSVVRMTGSGMGCPDWPKCFGYYIPPTHIETLQWQPSREFKKGQVIIIEEKLFTAKSNFLTGQEITLDNWKRYEKHNYAVFNVWHTWIEYINRLVTVVLGIPMLLLLVLSFFLYKKDKFLTMMTIATIVTLGIQAILGKIVVDTHLKAGMITVHMFFAFLLLAFVLILIYRAKQKATSLLLDTLTRNLIITAALITLLQVLLGTQVREYVDHQIDLLGYDSKKLWLRDAPFKFYLHRSFSIGIVLLNLYLLNRVLKRTQDYVRPKWAFVLILLSVVTGIAMYYFDFPFSSQPLHLVLAALLFGVQFYMVLETGKRNKSS